jgi:3-dehydroquinate synthase
MAFASALSAKKGYLPAEDKKRILKLLQTLNLSTRLQFDGAKVLDALKKDKKRERDQIHFVLLQRIGHAVIEKLTFEELASVIHEINS